MLNTEELQKVLNSIKVLNMSPDFGFFVRHIEGLLENDRIELETTKPDLIMLTQGRISAFREIIGYVNGVNEIESKLKECVNQGELE